MADASRDCVAASARQPEAGDPYRPAALRVLGIGCMTPRILVALLLARPLAAQTTTAKTLFTEHDARAAAGFVAVAIGISRFDPKIARFFSDTSLSHVRIGERLDKYATQINETSLTLAGIAAYGVGRLAKWRSLTDIAFHTTESIVTTSLASQLIRGPLGRSRPQETNSQDQYDFHWFKGFSDFKYRAFPSIHSASGFAAATALVEETRIRNPSAVKFVAPVLYGLAMTPGLSRMYLGQHWASDIFAGAFLGTFAAMKVVRYSHTHPGNRFQDFFVPSDGLQRVGFAWGTSF